MVHFEIILCRRENYVYSVLLQLHAQFQKQKCHRHRVIAHEMSLIA